MIHSVYILRFSDNSLYIGQTNNLARRLDEHACKNSKSAKFCKKYEVFQLAYQEDFASRLESMRREKQTKGWTRAKKEALIGGNLELLKRL